MGLDITFNLAAAVKAGMTVIKETNGTEELLLGKLPSYLHFFTVDTCNEYAQVRANKWDIGRRSTNNMPQDKENYLGRSTKQ